MRTQHGIRRWLLGSLVVVAVAVAALGSGLGASAEPGIPLPDYGSKEAFKRECERLGGTFHENSLLTSCSFPDFSQILCDANGRDCWYHPARYQPGGGANSPDGTGERNEDHGGTGFPGLPGRPHQNQPDTLPNLPAATD